MGNLEQEETQWVSPGEACAAARSFHEAGVPGLSLWPFRPRPVGGAPALSDASGGPPAHRGSPGPPIGGPDSDICWGLSHARFSSARPSPVLTSSSSPGTSDLSVLVIVCCSSQGLLPAVPTARLPSRRQLSHGGPTWPLTSSSAHFLGHLLPSLASWLFPGQGLPQHTVSSCCMPGIRQCPAHSRCPVSSC